MNTSDIRQKDYDLRQKKIELVLWNILEKLKLEKQNNIHWSLSVYTNSISGWNLEKFQPELLFCLDIYYELYVSNTFDFYLRFVPDQTKIHFDLLYIEEDFIKNNLNVVFEKTFSFLEESLNNKYIL